MTSLSEVATFAGGCFWCLEPLFDDLKGVSKVESGYMGGSVLNPSYKEICTGTTGHAEVIQITFEPAIITFHQLITVFWTMHDPTTLNRQGNDKGTQYRSAIFYHSDEQKNIAEETKKSIAEQVWEDPIVTEITAATTFTKAEEYHQNYFNTNPNQPYCSFVIQPKLVKFRKQFESMRKSK